MNLKLSQQGEEVRKEAYKIFDKNEKSATEDVEMVKDWLRTQHHLPEMMSL
jgi:ribosomal protein S19